MNVSFDIFDKDDPFFNSYFWSHNISTPEFENLLKTYEPKLNEEIAKVQHLAAVIGVDLRTTMYKNIQIAIIKIVCNHDSKISGTPLWFWFRYRNQKLHDYMTDIVPLFKNIPHPFLLNSNICFGKYLIEGQKIYPISSFLKALQDLSGNISQRTDILALQGYTIDQRLNLLKEYFIELDRKIKKDYYSLSFKDIHELIIEEGKIIKIKEGKVINDENICINFSGLKLEDQK